MILSVVTQLPMKQPVVRVAEQLILTLIGCKVLRPDKEIEISHEIFLVRLGIDVLEEHPETLDTFKNLLREIRKFACQLLDEPL